MGLSAVAAPAARRKVVRPVEDERAERERRDAPGDGLGLDGKDDLERQDDERDATADRQLLVEPLSPAQASRGGVVVGPLERRPDVVRLSASRVHRSVRRQGGCHGPPPLKSIP